VFLEINRPGKKNAICFECWELFDRYFDGLKSKRKIGAEEAKQLGLVNHVFPKENFRSHVTEYVKRITANGPMAIQMVK
jgi:enoyl-CoA hydratase/carnithine racemase